MSTQTKDEEDYDGTQSNKILCRSFSLIEIQLATNNFDDALIIGNGGFGKVFKGIIDDGALIVAIKRLNPESKQGEEEFWTEVSMLSKLQHNNLVSLVGYCNESYEMILVYEYISNGTIAEHFYENNRNKEDVTLSCLTWEQRLNICIGAARGLDYLHSGTNQCFIHRDVKATNILLDKNLVAKIADFGLSKSTRTHLTTHVSTNVKGTFGYLDPDYFLTRRLTKKSDVYAFGVVLLEVLCGRKAVDITLEEEQIGLVFWAQQCIKKGEIDRIIDPGLNNEISSSSLNKFVEITNKCLRDRPQARPTMGEVVTYLEHVLYTQQNDTDGTITKAYSFSKKNVVNGFIKLGLKGLFHVLLLSIKEVDDCSQPPPMYSAVNMYQIIRECVEENREVKIVEIEEPREIGIRWLYSHFEQSGYIYK